MGERRKRHQPWASSFDDSREKSQGEVTVLADAVADFAAVLCLPFFKPVVSGVSAERWGCCTLHRVRVTLLGPWKTAPTDSCVLHKPLMWLELRLDPRSELL